MLINDCVLGIDMGTSGARVGIFDLSGNPIIFCEEPYPLYTPASGYAEQKPDEWWDSICKASHRALEQSGIDPSCIRGMSCDTTSCTVLMSGDDMVPLRPAIMWMDVRASDQARRISDSGDDALKYTGYGTVSAEWLPCKALWLKENEPDLYHDATRFYECTDWLMYRLTGEYTASLNTASARWFYNNEEGGYPLGFYRKIGLEDLAEKLPPRVVQIGKLIGGLTQSAADDLGLIAGTPVGQGGTDAYVGVIGMNGISPGKLTLITGSSHLHIAQVDHEVHCKGLFGSYPDCLVPGLQMIEGGQTSTGSIVNWFKNQFCGNIKIQADQEGCSVYDILNREAAELPIGAEGLVALDYFQGNRTPYVDPDVRGMVYGLSLKHTPAHIYRAIIESICYGTEAIMEVFRDAGLAPDAMILSGGATRSPFWLQVHADVSDIAVNVMKCSEGPCLGSAILGAVAGGCYASIEEAAEAMTEVDYTVEPDKARHEEYMFYFEKYKEIYDVAKGCMHSITMHTK